MLCTVVCFCTMYTAMYFLLLYTVYYHLLWALWLFAKGTAVSYLYAKCHLHLTDNITLTPYNIAIFNFQRSRC